MKNLREHHQTTQLVGLPLCIPVYMYSTEVFPVYTISLKSVVLTYYTVINSEDLSSCGTTVIYLLTVKSVDNSVIRLQRINFNLVPSYTLSGENRSIYKSTGLIGSI